MTQEEIYFYAAQKHGNFFVYNDDELKGYCDNNKEVAKKALDLALEVHDEIAFCRLFSVIDADDSILNQRLWDIYSDSSLVDKFSVDKKARIYKRMQETADDYLKENFFTRSLAHMYRVFASCLKIMSPTDLSSSSLDKYIDDMPFGIQSQYYRKTKGRLGEVLLWLKYIIASMLFVLLANLGFKEVFNLPFFYTILPAITAYPWALITQMWGISSWLLPAPIAQVIAMIFSWIFPNVLIGTFSNIFYFLGGLLSTLAIAINFIFAPILFISAWVLMIKAGWALCKAVVHNILADPPDFNPVNTQPVLSKILSKEFVDRMCSTQDYQAKAQELRESNISRI